MESSDNFYKHTLLLACTTALLLCIPLAAMQFSNEVVWTFSDFIIAGGLLFGTGFLFLALTWKTENLTYKAATGLALASGLFMIWANLAVGLIGHEDQAANLMYFGVIAIGLISSFIFRFQAHYMAYTMYGMAATMVVITAIALSTGMQEYPGSSVIEILGVNTFFLLPFLLSGILFSHAAKDLQEIEADS